MASNDKEVTLNDLHASLRDIKQHLHWLYDVVNKGAKEGSSTTSKVKWMARKMGNHDPIIEDNHRDLYELMGTIGYMKEYLHKLVNMNQCSHCQTSPARDHPMDETSVAQPVKTLGDKQQ